MINFLRSLFPSAAHDKAQAKAPNRQPDPPAELYAPGVESFAFRSYLQYVNKFPVPDWKAVSEWLGSLTDPGEQAKLWTSCEMAWLQHLRVALGPEYYLDEAGDSILLSPLDRSISQATLGFMNKTQARISRILHDIALIPKWKKNILIVFDDDDAYYRYVSRYYLDDGEFARSSGMHINTGCSHFVTIRADLWAIEPVIAHEMTHGVLGHLPIPVWLNEGIAVNTEQRLCPPPRPLFTAREMHEKHLEFWGTKEIQEFWSGKSFLRTDDGNTLSYDLARILVSQFSSDWESFRGFVLAADARDAGATAAHEHLGVDLGASVAAIFKREDTAGWTPDLDAWHEAPKRVAS
ncbi:MAG: hypothetical protein LBI68_05275 [Azoarcus sp.]|jgi:hypothetical protein|nr:hypothetical protein [Azoarcus sp.]